MSNPETIDVLFDLTIAAEKIAQELYLGLEAKFAHHQDVAGFWRMYAGEEAGHIRWLERIRSNSSPERLSAPADPHILEDARRFLKFSPHNALKEIKTLEDGYQLANELESSELNVVFEFMITKFASDEQARSFLRAQLREHVALLINAFPARFKNTASRRSVSVLG